MPELKYKRTNYKFENDKYYKKTTGDWVEVQPTGIIRDGRMYEVVLLYENGDSVDILCLDRIITISKDEYFNYIETRDFQVGDYVRLRKESEIDSSIKSRFFYWSNYEPSFFNHLDKVYKITNISDKYRIDISDEDKSYNCNPYLIKSKLSQTEVDKIKKAKRLEKLKIVSEKYFNEKIEGVTNDKIKQFRAYMLAVRKEEKTLAEKAGTVEKFYNELLVQVEKSIEKIEKFKNIEKVEFDDDMLVIRAWTKPLFIEYGRKEYIDCFSGQFQIAIHILDGRVEFRNHEKVEFFENYIHPHANPSGKPCWGNLNQGVGDSFKTMDFYGVLINAMELLQGITGSTYYNLYNQNLNRKSELESYFSSEGIKYDFEKDIKAQELTENTCDDCGEAEDDCECDRCSTCNYNNCECSECEYCGIWHYEDDCDCLPCDDCGDYPWDCLAEICEKCKNCSTNCEC